MRKNVWKTWKMAFVSLAVTILVTAGLAVTAKAGGASFAAAQPVPFGQKQQINFETSGAAHYYYFTTDSTPGWYSINLGKSYGEAKYIYIYATADTSSKVDSWYQSGDGNSTRTYSLLPNKRYYILVEPRSNKIGGTANFTITKINDDYSNDLATGRVIPLGTTVTGNIEVADKGEVDAFRFTTTGNNSYYEMSLSCTGQEETCARIYKGPDTSYDHYDITAYPGNTRSIIEKLEKNKTYYVILDGNYWDDPTSYKFVVKEIKDDAGNDFADATTLKNGKTVSRTIQVNADTDFYKLKTAKKQAYYMLTFKNKSKSSMYVTVYNNNDIASAVSGANNIYVPAASTKTIWLKLRKNTYNYVKVTGEGNCSYNIQLKDLKSVVKKTAPSSFKAKGYSGYWSRYATLTWKHKYENAKYEIYRSTSPKSGFKRIKTVTNASSYTDQKVKKNRTYYYKIRYCVKENGKVHKAKWSKVKKVKIK